MRASGRCRRSASSGAGRTLPGGLLAIASRKVEKVFWWTLKDGGTRQFDQADMVGLARADLSPKYSYYAFAVMARMLEGRRWARNDSFGPDVFAALYLTGVYPICGFVDLFVLNTIEFWTKDEPATTSKGPDGAERKTIVDGAHRFELERRRIAGGWRVRVQVFEADRLVDDSVLLYRDDGTCDREDPSGRKTATYEARPDGSVALKKPEGGVDRIYLPGEIASILR